MSKPETTGALAPGEGPTLTLYGFSTCPHCASLKSYLVEHGLPFAAINVEDAGDRQRLYDAWELEGPERTMPQLRVEGVSLGGDAAVRRFPLEQLRAIASG